MAWSGPCLTCLSAWQEPIRWKVKSKSVSKPAAGQAFESGNVAGHDVHVPGLFVERDAIPKARDGHRFIGSLELVEGVRKGRVEQPNDSIGWARNVLDILSQERSRSSGTGEDESTES